MDWHQLRIPDTISSCVCVCVCALLLIAPRLLDSHLGCHVIHVHVVHDLEVHVAGPRVAALAGAPQPVDDRQGDLLEGGLAAIGTADAFRSELGTCGIF